MDNIEEIYLLDAFWEEGFEHLEEYVRVNGNARVVPSYVSPDDYKLGRWVERQRITRGSLDGASKARLEMLPGWLWKAPNIKWEEGFEYLEEYVAANGDASVPLRHITPDGYDLWKWVERQKASRKTLDVERKDRLEALKGWRW